MEAKRLVIKMIESCGRMARVYAERERRGAEGSMADAFEAKIRARACKDEREDLQRILKAIKADEAKVANNG